MAKKSEIHRNWKHLDLFGDNKIALSLEIVKHPELMEILAKYTDVKEDFEIILAETSAYCGIILDGEYNILEIEALCGVLQKKLISKRVGIVFASEVKKH